MVADTPRERRGNEERTHPKVRGRRRKDTLPEGAARTGRQLQGRPPAAGLAQEQRNWFALLPCSVPRRHVSPGEGCWCASVHEWLPWTWERGCDLMAPGQPCGDSRESSRDPSGTRRRPFAATVGARVTQLPSEAEIRFTVIFTVCLPLVGWHGQIYTLLLSNPAEEGQVTLCNLILGKRRCSRAGITSYRDPMRPFPVLPW